MDTQDIGWPSTGIDRALRPRIPLPVLVAPTSGELDEQA